MSESLTEWYKGFMAERAARGARLRPPVVKKVVKGICGECGVRRVSKGEGQTSRYARRAGLCSTCYGGKRTSDRRDGS